MQELHPKQIRVTIAPVKVSPPTFEINVGGGTFTHETVPRDAIIGVEGGMCANGAKGLLHAANIFVAKITCQSKILYFYQFHLCWEPHGKQKHLLRHQLHAGEQDDKSKALPMASTHNLSKVLKIESRETVSLSILWGGGSDSLKTLGF